MYIGVVLIVIPGIYDIRIASIDIVMIISASQAMIDHDIIEVDISGHAANIQVRPIDPELLLQLAVNT